jgi:signal transduction histidine kinase
MKFPNLSIRVKLTIMVMATTLVALSLAGGALALFEIQSHRRTLASEVAAMAEIVGQNLAAPLILEKADSAERALRPLESQPPVISACLYDSAGALFARYLRRGQPGRCPRRPTPDEAGFRDQRLIQYHPIPVIGQAAATLRVVATLDELERQVRLFGAVLLLVLTGAALAALLLSSWLQGLVARPILALARTAQQISGNRDYTLRAPQQSHDEVGVAVEAFNEMLDRIQAAVLEQQRAEQALIALNATLEQRVAERTAAAESKAEELRRSNEELEQFASVASHDLQEPLRTVASYTQLLGRRLDGSGDPEVALYFGHVLTAVGRMKALITDLLDYARVGSETGAAGPVDTSAVLDAVLADLSPALTENAARVTRGPLPIVWASAGLVQQLLANLLSNALRFRGDAAPVVDVSAERDGDRWRFAVRDNGIGIDRRHHQRIFVMFQRLHGADRPGTGIGLAICRKVVELYGGRIWVDSEPGRGATFRFTLPAPPTDDGGGLPAAAR